MSIIVANKVYRYFWSLVFWRKFKIKQYLGPYCEHKGQRFLFNVYKRFFLFLSRFLRYFNVFYFDLNVFYIYDASYPEHRFEDGSNSAADQWGTGSVVSASIRGRTAQRKEDGWGPLGWSIMTTTDRKHTPHVL